MAERLYLYAIVDSAVVRSHGAIGLGHPPSEVCVLPVDGLGVAVSRTTRGDFPADEDELLTYEKTLEALLRDYTVLPFGYGTSTACEADLHDLIAASRHEIDAALTRLRGRVEEGLKVFWLKDAVRRELESRFGRLPDPSAGGLDYDRIVQVGQQVQGLVDEWKAHFVPEIIRALEPISVDWCEAEPIGVRMLFNGAFLLPRQAEPAFLERVHVLDRRYGNRLQFRCVGPLPPFNFLHLRLVPPAANDDVATAEVVVTEEEQPT